MKCAMIGLGKMGANMTKRLLTSGHEVVVFDLNEEAIRALADPTDSGDVIVDGGNSNYRDSMRRAFELREKGLYFVNVGTSGGFWLPCVNSSVGTQSRRKSDRGKTPHQP